MEKDMVDTESRAFFGTYDAQTIPLRFGTDFSEEIVFKDRWKFPNADGMCSVYSYWITC